MSGKKRYTGDITEGEARAFLENAIEEGYIPIDLYEMMLADYRFHKAEQDINNAVDVILDEIANDNTNWESFVNKLDNDMTADLMERSFAAGVEHE